MKGSNGSKKRLFAWVPPALHAHAKAQASIEGKFLEEWVESAVEEKLARSSRKK